MTLKAAYENVFNTDGTTKLCGRTACQNLIKLCEEMTGEVGQFGNTKTGIMNIPAIQSFALVNA